MCGALEQPGSVWSTMLEELQERLVEAVGRLGIGERSPNGPRRTIDDVDPVGEVVLECEDVDALSRKEGGAFMDRGPLGLNVGPQVELALGQLDPSILGGPR